MILLHGAALDGHLLIWAESPADGACRVPGRRGRRPASAPPPASPLDAGTVALAAALDAVLPAAAVAEPGHAVAWLPTSGGAPLPSDPLIAEPPASRSGPFIAPWTVTAVRLPAAQAVNLLAACAGRRMAAPGIVEGADLAFWSSVLRLAGALVVRQQILPGIVRRGDDFFARWQPAATGGDAGRVVALAARMPHACRAITDDAGTPPDTAAVDVLAGVLEAFVDVLARPPAQSPAAAPAARPALPHLAARGMAGLRPRDFDSVHDQWLHALRSADGRMHGPAADLEKFAAQVAAWRRPVTLTADAPMRLCFRLEEPVTADTTPDASVRSTWRISYLLQDAADPSLLVPASDAFRARGAAAAALSSRGTSGSFDARAYLLSSLGQCASMSPAIEASLRSRAPSGYSTDAAGAHAFLTQTAFLLEQAGFGVLLPAWWTGRGTKRRLAVRARVKSPKLRAGSALSLDTMLKVDWEVALGDETIGLDELQALARLKAPLVRVRGQWVELGAGEIQAALDFWKARSTQTTSGTVVRLALGAPPASHGLAFEGVTATGWMGEVLARLEGAARIEPLPAPDGLRGTLRPYQERGFAWLAFMRAWGFGACLADDMGLGKSIQTLAAIAHDREAGGRGPTLIVCPTSVVANWQKEAERFTPGLSVLVHHGVARDRGAAFRREVTKHAVVVSTYALLQRDVELFARVAWRGVVLDEAQNIKNPETKQAKAARALTAGYRVALTGTPVENTVGDLWSVMEFLNPGWLGSQAEFRRTFFLPIQASRDPEAQARLRRLTGPFVLRRLKSDRSIIADLPDKLEMKVFCTLTREQATLYQAVADEATAALATRRGIKRRGLVLATLTKLKQVCNHPAQFLADDSAIPGRSGKLARLTEMLDEALAEGDRALVFTQFAEMGEILKRHLQETFGCDVPFLHGAVPKAKRDRVVERFQGAGGPPIFLLSLKAGGTGLNLTAANRVFHFDRWWNPAVETQATDRAYRIGQSRAVQVHAFVCAGTLEEKIDEMIEAKRDVAVSVVGAGESWLTELSTAELKKLFALGREAVGA